MIEIKTEPNGDILQVRSTGEATRADIDAHYAALRSHIADMRTTHQPIRVLSDQTHAVRLSDELSRYLKEQIERTYQPGDRLALLMRTEDDKAYAKSILGKTDYAVFNSRIAAEIWLMEPNLQAPA